MGEVFLKTNGKSLHYGASADPAQDFNAERQEYRNQRVS